MCRSKQHKDPMEKSQSGKQAPKSVPRGMPTGLLRVYVELALALGPGVTFFNTCRNANAVLIIYPEATINFSTSILPQ